jgi:hypothetical protein
MNEPQIYQLMAMSTDMSGHKLSKSTKIKGMRLPYDNPFLLSTYIKTAICLRVDHKKFIDPDQFMFKKAEAGSVALTDLDEVRDIQKVRKIEFIKDKSNDGPLIYWHTCEIISLQMHRLKLFMKDLLC